MGKICLVDGKTAKRYIPLFVEELEKSDSAAIRNNLVVMMVDFCVRYTALIDCFVEAIIVLHDCRAHGGHCSSQSSHSESRLFSIRGTDEISGSKRMRIYTCLLKQMAPEHLLATFAKICAEILAAASDGMLNIEDATGQSVLQILACKEICLPTSRNSTLESPEMDDESNGSGGTSPVAAKGRVISQAARKSLIQNTIPIFIELKRLLESPLTGSLMDCLRLLLKDYKNEIDEILVADKQLQRELLYDMQKHESAKARSEAAETVAVMGKSGNNHTPQSSNALSGASR
ncbi:hypothetical protein EUGRSUZ_C00458 [Eucalyptus grandis]|uniref:Uncharacterized protein n=2 Tax=Eucalyptus grandis TaxID=71139 RepID=A0ACC3LAG8_EUCGR|nr:hypothetical protein EUGRSUZ_C00458 [Eucalyptus grandis]